MSLVGMSFWGKSIVLTFTHDDPSATSVATSDMSEGAGAPSQNMAKFLIDSVNLIN